MTIVGIIIHLDVTVRLPMQEFHKFVGRFQGNGKSYGHETKKMTGMSYKNII